MALKKARVLVAIAFADLMIQPNNVIEAEASVIKGYGDAVDDSAAAVKYCIENEGGKVFRLEEKPVADDAAKAKALDDAQAAVDAAQKAFDEATGDEAKAAADRVLADATAVLLKLQQ